MEGSERLKQEAEHPGLVGGKVINKGTYIQDPCWAPQDGQVFAPALQICLKSNLILKVYKEALTGFSHRYSPDGLSNILLSQGCICASGSGCGNSGHTAHSKDRRSLPSMGFDSRVNWQSHCLLTFSKSASFPLMRNPVGI